MRREQAARSRRRRMILIASAVVGVLVIGGGITAVVLAAHKNATPSASASLAGVQTFTEERNHVTGKVTTRRPRRPEGTMPRSG